MTLTISIESTYKDHPKVNLSVSAGMIYGTAPTLAGGLLVYNLSMVSCTVII